MLPRLAEWIWPSIRFIIVTSIIRGLFLWWGFEPEKSIAQMLGYATTLPLYVGWLIAALLALPGTFVAEKYWRLYAQQKSAISSLSISKLVPMDVTWRFISSVRKGKPIFNQKDGKSIKCEISGLGAGKIKNCTGSVVKVEKLGGLGDPEILHPKYSIKLPWAHHSQEPEKLDIAPGIPEQFSIASTSEGKDFWEIRAVSTANKNPPQYTQHGDYRLTVAVSGDGTTTVSKTIHLRWNGHWDQIEAKLL